jgi:WD40 repeat protein
MRVVREAFWALVVAVLMLPPLETAAQDNLRVDVVAQIGHAAEISSVTFSPDGRLVLSADLEGALLWDTATGKLLRHFQGTARRAVFSSDGRSVISATGDGKISILDTATGQQLRSLKADGSSPKAVSRDGRLLLSANWETLNLWDLASNRLLWTKEHMFPSEDGAFSPDGRRVLTGDKRTMTLRDVETGQVIRTFEGHTSNVTLVAFSPDGRNVLSYGLENVLKLWDVTTGKLLQTIKGDQVYLKSVAFSPDGNAILLGSSRSFTTYDVATAQISRHFDADADGQSSVAFSPDGKLAASGSITHAVKLWSLATGEMVRSFAGQTGPVGALALSPDGHSLLAGSVDGYDFNQKRSKENRLRLWDVDMGTLTHTFAGHRSLISAVAFSPDGRTVLSGAKSGFGSSLADNTLRLWDLATTRLVRTLEGHDFGVTSAVFAADGSLVSVGADHKLKHWDVASGKLLRIGEIPNRRWSPRSVAISPDGANVATSSGFAGTYGDQDALRIWELNTGKLLRTFVTPSGIGRGLAYFPDGRGILLGTSLAHSLQLLDLTTGKTKFTGSSRWGTSVVFARDSSITSMVLSRDGRTALSGSTDRTVKLWDTDTGGLLRTFKGHASEVSSVVMFPDDRAVISGSRDGTIRLWSLSDGRELLRLLAGGEDGWLAITPDGFFNASSSSAAHLVAVVRGIEGYEIGQLWHSLFNPDLVREALAGDPSGEVRQAANVANLEMVVSSGPPPGVAILSPAEGSQSPADLITVTARIEDQGKGVGRIEWRVNGVTAAVATRPDGDGPTHTVSRQLALDPGDNAVEVVAYNGSNLLASLPARTTVRFTGSADNLRSKLHLLAIGINAYVDKGWTPPGSKTGSLFPTLDLAVKDAKAFAADMEKAAAGLYDEVRVTLALDQDATRANLPKVVDKIAAQLHPRDTFILFAAAHGYSLNGRFYLIPQDYQGGINPEALATRAIGQDELQDWLANRIRARKAIILLDTCESGALVGGHTRSRTDAPAAEAALGRLHEATGRPVLTAAAEGNPAFEGYEGHGVFTWSLLDALKNGDRNGNGTIELSELVTHVQDQVPRIAARLNGSGRAAIAVRGSDGDSQSARFGSRGEDWVLARRLH